MPPAAAELDDHGRPRCAGGRQDAQDQVTAGAEQRRAGRTPARRARSAVRLEVISRHSARAADDPERSPPPPSDDRPRRGAAPVPSYFSTARVAIEPRTPSPGPEQLASSSTRSRARAASRVGVERRPRAPRLPAGVQPSSASRIAATSSGGATTPAPTRGSARRRLRRAGRRRGSAARRRGTRRPSRRARPCRGPRPPGSAAAAPPSRAGARATGGAGTYGISSSRSPRPRLSAHSRSAGRKSPTKRATTSRPDSASAVRNGRGSRRPKKLPVWVIRNRGDAMVLHPGEVVEVGAVRDRHDRPVRLEPARLVGDRIGGGDDRVGVAGDERGDAVLALLLDPDEPLLVAAAVRVGDERVAEVGDPAARRSRASRRRRRSAPSCGGDVVSTTSIPSRRTIRIAAGIAVRFQGTFSSGTSRRRPNSRAWTPARSRPCVPCSSSAGRRPRGADVARPVDPGLGRRLRARRRGAPTSGRRERARASRSRARAGAWRSSACAGRRRRPAGGKYSVTSRTFTRGDGRGRTARPRRPAGGRAGASSGAGRRRARSPRSGAGSPGRRCGRTPARRRAARTAGSPSCRRRGRGRRVGDVDRRERGDLVARRVVGEDDRFLGHTLAQRRRRARRQAACRGTGRSSQCVKPCSATGSIASAAVAAAIGPIRSSSRQRRGRTIPAASAAAQPKSATQVASAGPAVRRARSRSRRGRRAGTRSRRRARPGARRARAGGRARPRRRRRANGNGTKPAARRACEIETTSEKRVNSVGTSISTSTASEAAEHEGGPAAARGERRRAARRRARATATAPAPAEAPPARAGSSRPRRRRAGPCSAGARRRELGRGRVHATRSRARSAAARARRRRPGRRRPRAPALPSTSSVRASRSRATT